MRVTMPVPQAPIPAHCPLSPFAVQGVEGVAPDGRERWKVLWEEAVTSILASIMKYHNPRFSELTPTFIIIVSGGGQGCAYERWMERGQGMGGGDRG